MSIITWDTTQSDTSSVTMAMAAKCSQNSGSFSISRKYTGSIHTTITTLARPNSIRLPIHTRPFKFMGFWL